MELCGAGATQDARCRGRAESEERAPALRRAPAVTLESRTFGALLTFGLAAPHCGPKRSCGAWTWAKRFLSSFSQQRSSVSAAPYSRRPLPQSAAGQAHRLRSHAERSLLASDPSPQADRHPYSASCFILPRGRLSAWPPWSPASFFASLNNLDISATSCSPRQLG